MAWQDDPDRALARWEAEEDARLERRERQDRIADHTPAPLAPSEGEGARITSAMGTLAWTVLHGAWHDAREASRVLAELILEAVR